MTGCSSSIVKVYFLSLQVAVAATFSELLAPIEAGFGSGSFNVTQLINTLGASDDANAPGALAFLHLVGFTGESVNDTIPRDIDRATELIVQGGADCPLCTTLAGFLASVGYPAMVNNSDGAIVVAEDGELDVTISIRSDKAPAAGSSEARQLPRELVGGDFVGSAYALASFDSEPLAELAHAHYLASNMTDGDTYELGGRLAGAALRRAPSPLSAASCAAAVDILVAAATAKMNQDASALPQLGALQDVVASEDRQSLEVVRLLQSRAAQDDPEALASLGDVYYSGHDGAGIARDSEIAVEKWKAAASKGHSGAAMAVAQLVVAAKGDMTEAAPYLQQVAESGAFVQQAMAKHYIARHGLAGPVDPQVAGEQLQIAADAGDSNAQLVLGHAFAGIDVEGVAPPGGLNKSLAAKYYRMASDSGRLLGRFNAAVLALEDEDARHNPQKCMRVYQDLSDVTMAASREIRLLGAIARRAFAAADYEGAALTSMLISELGHPQGHVNSALAWALLAEREERACDSAAEDCIQRGKREYLHCWAAHGSKLPDASTCSFHYWRRAAAAGNVPAIHKVTDAVLEWGDDVTSHASEAFYWMTQAAKHGDPRGLFERASMLETRGDLAVAYMAFMALLLGEQEESLVQQANEGFPTEVRLAAAVALAKASALYLSGGLPGDAPAPWEPVLNSIPELWDRVPGKSALRWVRDATIGLLMLTALCCAPSRL
mmetsp:Transcript_52665/g.120083  ORF Transcript_52665/g.120083 Transcript_52665/m.120083 type:complete len:720 (-) Transcript_52665:99-2258(-)